MYRKALSLVLLGILLIGGLAVGYGTFFDQGFASSVASVVGAGEDEHDDDDHEYGEHREDDDD